MKYASQKEATFAAVTQVFAENKIKFEASKTVAATHITRGSPIRKQVIAVLVAMFTNHEAPLVSGQTDLPKYCSGLLNNWLRRDERLNGGQTYVPDIGSNDEQIKAMTKLLAQCPEAAGEINAAIEKRRQEVVMSRKASAVSSIDVSKLPEHLRKLVS